MVDQTDDFGTFHSRWDDKHFQEVILLKLYTTVFRIPKVGHHVLLLDYDVLFTTKMQ